MPRPNRFEASVISATLASTCAIACGSHYAAAQVEQPRAATDRTLCEDDPTNNAVEQPDNERRVATAKDNEEQLVKAVRTDRLVHISPVDISFQLPQQWIDLNDKSHNNLHFTKEELAAVKNGGEWGLDIKNSKSSGNWDREFGTVVNATLLFERCALHAGGEGWGPGSTVSDIQMRVYVLDEGVEKVNAKVAAAGTQAVRTLFTPRRVLWRGQGGRPANYRPKLPDNPDRAPEDMKVPTKRSTRNGWRQVALSYLPDYGDYEMSFGVDFRLRQFRDKTVAVVLMYRDWHEYPEGAFRSANLTRQNRTIDPILASLTEAKKEDDVENRSVVDGPAS